MTILGAGLVGLLWAMGLPMLLSLTRPLIGRHADTAYRVVSVACGLALMAFALALGQSLVSA